MVRKIGLTGGIGSGKSLVQKQLDEEGVPTIDADQVTHDLYANDEELLANIRREFGDRVFNPDGTVDRKKLGDIVFNQPERLKLLSSWIHPKVRERIAGFFQEHRDEPLAVAVIPVLFESGLEAHYDEIWVVDARPEQQKDRLVRNRDLSPQEAQARINSQIPLAEKVQRADVVIDNTGTPDETRKQVQRLIQAVRA